MSQMSEDYSQRLGMETAALGREEGALACFNHLHAFYFGRAVARREQAEETFWLHVRWLSLGAAVGMTLAAVYLQTFLRGGILHISK